MPYRLLLVAALLVALAAPALAQTAVSGTVLDESGGALPDASVTLVSGQARLITITSATGQYRFDNVPAGTYAMSVLLIGFAPASRDNVVVGSESVVVPAIMVKVAGFEEAVIVTASRIGGSLLDAPATMTVLPAATISVLPAQNIGDLLRTVPGVNVIQMSARDINITSRQATSTAATSQLALLDGRSIYLDFFGLILWDFVPTNPNDIKQIEVVRGPASAVWGANALTGAVNIITKSPRETAGVDQRHAEWRLVRSRRRIDRRQRRRRVVRRRRQYLARRQWNTGRIGSAAGTSTPIRSRVPRGRFR